MAQHPHTTLITGANRGIGFAILQAVAAKSPNARYLLASRSILSGQIALQQLKDLGIQTHDVHLIELDVSSEESIKAAQSRIRNDYTRLDVLINNAGIAIREAPDHSNLQSSYTEIFNTNITSVALMMTHFLPLLKESSPENARVINISSARASLQLSSTGNLPPSQVIAYSVSKTALNALTVEYAKVEPAVRFYAASPGHCRTAFNGYRGTKDPLDGARVVVELATAEGGKYGNGFWELEGEEGGVVVCLGRGVCGRGEDDSKLGGVLELLDDCFDLMVMGLAIALGLYSRYFRYDLIFLSFTFSSASLVLYQGP